MRSGGGAAPVDVEEFGLPAAAGAAPPGNSTAALILEEEETRTDESRQDES